MKQGLKFARVADIDISICRQFTVYDIVHHIFNLNWICPSVFKIERVATSLQILFERLYRQALILDRRTILIRRVKQVNQGNSINLDIAVKAQKLSE